MPSHTTLRVVNLRLESALLYHLFMGMNRAIPWDKDGLEKITEVRTHKGEEPRWASPQAERKRDRLRRK
jgi:hypothetical protein